MTTKSGQSFLAYFGAFGTVWTLLRDFGLDAEAALILVVFAAGVLVGLRLRVILRRYDAVQQSSSQQSSAKPAPSSGELTQQPSPRHASAPSRTATAAISRPTIGSSHQAPTSALPSNPTRSAPAR